MGRVRRMRPRVAGQDRVTGEAWEKDQASLLLNRRLAQVTWMRTPLFDDYLANYLSDSGIGVHMRGASARTVLRDAFLTQWVQGKNFVLSYRALAAVRSAAETLTLERHTPALSADVIPAPAGLIVFPRDIYGQGTSDDGNPVSIATSAISWSPCYVTANIPGVLATSWAHRDAPDDDVLHAVRRQRVASSEFTAQAVEDARRLRGVIADDASLSLAERQKMDDLATQRLRRARQAEKTTMPIHLPDYVLGGMHPVPLNLPYRLSTDAPVLPKNEPVTRTTPLSHLDSEAHTFPVRLLLATWGLMQAGLLQVSEVTLPKAALARHQKRSLPYEVLSLDLAPETGAQSLVTVRRDRADMLAETNWAVLPHEGGRVL